MLKKLCLTILLKKNAEPLYHCVTWYTSSNMIKPVKNHVSLKKRNKLSEQNFIFKNSMPSVERNFKKNQGKIILSIKIGCKINIK